MHAPTFALNREEVVTLLREARDERDEARRNLKYAEAAARGYKKERDVLLALVLGVECVPDPSDMGDRDYCPWCFEAKPEHAEFCKREAAIAKAKDGH
jgi:hypothetical protein